MAVKVLRTPNQESLVKLIKVSAGDTTGGRGLTRREGVSLRGGGRVETHGVLSHPQVQRGILP